MRIVHAILLTGLLLTPSILAAEIEVTHVTPTFTSVDDMLSILGATLENGRHVMRWGEREVDIRAHASSNTLLLSGDDAATAEIAALIAELDLAPKQIELEAQIIEVNRSKVKELGIDWDGLWRNSGTGGDAILRRLSDDNEQTTSNDVDESTLESERESKTWQYSLHSRAQVSAFVHFLDENGAGRMSSAPRVTTLNNKRARILDGQHVTYVTRASAYSNIYETQEMEAGLRLEVLPTTGDSDYLNLEITAELTYLADPISGSPVKDGQIIDNHVVVRSGEPIVLGGFKKTVERKQTKRFPLLGHILPFLFSHEVSVDESYDSIVILTARVLTLDEPLSEQQRELLGGPTP